MTINGITKTVRSETLLRTAVGYTPAAMVLHWIMFLLVVVVGVLGLLHDSWPKQTQAFWINVHALCGLLLWTLLLARFRWRIGHVPPSLPPDVGEFSRRLSGPVHLTLYLLMFVIPIIGVITFVWHGRTLDLALFQVNFGVRKNPAVFHPTEDLHGYLAYGLFGLAGIHALAALWHHFVRRDAVLGRMWPTGSRAP
jgi:cytochrome b561